MAGTRDRVTSFGVQASGARSFGVTVNGLRVLITAEDGLHDAGLALATAVSDLGPETLSEPAPNRVAAPTALAQVSAKRRDFRIGQRVWCNVHASRGWCTVVEVGVGHNRGRIKISGLRAWCPIHNFDESAPEGV